MALAVNLPAMSEAKDQHDKAVVFEFADEAVVADTVFPEFAQSRAVQRLSHTSWIVQACDSFEEKLQDALGLRRVKFAQLAVRLSGQLNLPSHSGSSRLSGGWPVPRHYESAREGEIQILQIGKVLKDGFPDIVSLGAPSAAGQLF